MAGARWLRTELVLLKRLATGAATKADLKRALCWDPVLPSKALDSILSTMRVAGLIEPVGRGEWQLTEGCELCPTCHGRGILVRGGVD